MSTQYDRVADIPVRHGFTDYVCTIGYSNADGEFHFISARRANPLDPKPPAKPFDLYLRVLREPALRANLIEALVPGQRGHVSSLREEAIVERARSHGLAAGIAALAIVGFALYWLTEFLARRVGYDTAELITYLPMFFAFLVMFPVRDWYASWYLRRHCAMHSHRLHTWSDETGRSHTMCKRCGLFIGSSRADK